MSSRGHEAKSNDVTQLRREEPAGCQEGLYRVGRLCRPRQAASQGAMYFTADSSAFGRNYISAHLNGPGLDGRGLGTL